MDCVKIGQLIKKRRQEKGMTQQELATKLYLSNKTISKWERGVGCPDIGNFQMLAEVLDININELMQGEAVDNDNRGGNMKKTQFYVCPVCDNVITSTNELVLSCCGQKLEALVPKKNEKGNHEPSIEMIEDDLYVTFEHAMNKEHYISFVAYVTMDKVHLMKLYPEQNPEVRFHKRGRGLLYMYCKEDGLWCQTI
ncbi:MAG: helix-turn-helix domain-containing protein [Cellulosilyticaceae bacterium]